MAAQTLTMTQTAKAFGVTYMTVHTWRVGTATKTRKLPADVTKTAGGKSVVALRVAELKKWAKENGLKFDPALVDSAEETKPGPKAKVAPAKKAVAKKVAKKAARAAKH